MQEQKPTKEQPVKDTNTAGQSNDPSLTEPVQNKIEPAKKNTKQWLVIGSIVLLIILLVFLAIWLVMRYKTKTTATKTQPTTSVVTENANQVTSLRLDTNKNYGNKYSNGILPVGDNKYSTAGAKLGYVYLCHKPDSGGGGAETRGPWFINNNTEYDINKKPAVTGNVPWQSSYSMNVSGATRTVATNDLPNNHNTGTFPIGKTDPAYQYDRNPNHIAAQSLTYSLNAQPTATGQVNCIGGEAGVMTTGVALFDAFDAGGRDAGAWEVQDSCSGHPQNTSEYHYHTLSSCIKDTSVTEVIGYALDGFPITGPKVGENNILTTSDLDECHGITSTINLDGKQTTIYHYVMTQDFPYSISCFRSTAINPPGMQQMQMP